MCVNCHRHRVQHYLWLSHSAPPFLSLHTLLQFQYTICGIPTLHSTMQNTEISESSFCAMGLQEYEWSDKQPMEEFMNKHSGYQRNTSATGWVPCPQLNDLCDSSVAYLLCRHWCPGLQPTCSSLISLYLYRSNNYLQLQLVRQMLHGELWNGTVWFPSHSACHGKLHRLIWTQKRRDVFQPFGLKV